ncbi:MAG TPA: Flp family type IVb pilin [Actinomycetes bacterium]|nr:Flp family type IVb pilin [Actinomycetes bacterium]
MRGAGRRDHGVTSVEYAIMAAIVVLLLIAGVAALYDGVQARFDRDASCAAEAYDDVGC